MERTFKSLCCVEGSLERVFKLLCCVEGSVERVFKSLCCVVHYLVQDYCIGVHDGLFIVLHGGAYWIVQIMFRLEKEAGKRNGWSV